jgi:AcrR family transcriptional regulator
MNTTDRRVRRTQKALGDALIALALEKDYDEITIQEITERADIGYRTFFRHYTEKDDLLKDVLSSIKVEISELMSPPPLDFFMNPDAQLNSPNSTLLFRHVQENCNLYHVLLFSNRGLVKSLKEYAIQEFKSNYPEIPDPTIPIEILLNHITSSMITLMRWWLDNDMPYSPEEMGDYASRMIIRPLRELILQGKIEKDE